MSTETIAPYVRSSRTYYLAWATLLFAFVASVLVTPRLCLACACGCGMFEVETPTLIPTSVGGMIWTEWDFLNQYVDWHGTGHAPKGLNDDRQIKTDFVTLGLQYMFNRSWGIEAEIPYWNRTWKGVTDAGTIGSYTFDSIGDIRIMGMYTGIEEDMSLGLLFGFKLPTGDWHYANVDRDTEIGTGSTDILLGAYKMGNLPFNFGYYVQGLYDIPFLTQGGYTPGREFDMSAGIFYNLSALGRVRELISSWVSTLAPMLSVLYSNRIHDSGPNADPLDTGYNRILIAPGFEIQVKNFMVYADVELPIFQQVNGYQLVAPLATKLIVTYMF